MPPHASILRQHGYRQLFIAQVLALLGTGLLTVALSLLAFDVAPDSAGAVVATALTVKMIAYVGGAPAIAALTSSVPSRVVLLGADGVRFVVAMMLPFVDEVWQIYVLIFVLQAASATFTPAYQALLPTVLPRREDYTRALSFSRLAYDLETVLSPLLAAGALLVVSYHGLFVGTAIGFVASATFVLRSGHGRSIPTAETLPFSRRLTAGMRLFARHPSLRAVVLLDLAAAAATATVLVNTVVVARQQLGRGEDSVAVALAVFGAGSMMVALALPRMLRSSGERPVMLAGSATVAAALFATPAATAGGGSWPTLLTTWFVLGAAGSAVMTPGGRVVTAAVMPAERPAAFAAHFSLSHACYLLAYPVAGWVGSRAGVATAAVVLAVIAAAATLGALVVWADDAPVRTTKT